MAEPNNDIVKRIKRVNLKSVRNAIILYLYLTKRGYKADLAISSDRIVMLDLDSKDPEKFALFLRLVKEICREYVVSGRIFETPNGYHFITLRPLPRSKWREIYVALLQFAEAHGVPDYYHVKACLERGYATLRLGRQIKCVMSIDYKGRIQKKCPEYEHVGGL